MEVVARIVRRSSRYLLYIWLPAALILLWWFVPPSKSVYFPALPSVLDDFRKLWLFQDARADLLPSVEHFFYGFVIAVVGGIALGVLLSFIPTLYKVSLPVISFFRGLPSIALIPPLILILGLGGTFKVGIIVLGAIQPVLLNTINGIQSADEVQLDTARAFGLTRRQRIMKVILPSASPQIVAGARTAVQVAILLMVASEIIAATSGIGYIIASSQQAFDGPAMWSGMLVLGLLGIILNVLFLITEKWVLRWYLGMRALEARS